MVCHAKRTTPLAVVQSKIATAGKEAIDWRTFPRPECDAVLNIALLGDRDSAFPTMNRTVSLVRSSTRAPARSWRARARQSAAP